MSPDTVTPAGRWALFLDVDGTLLDFAATPDRVLVPESLKTLLVRLSLRLDGALAIVSGRSIDNLDTLFAPLKLPASGVHGCERRETNGCVVRPAKATPELDRMREEIRVFVETHAGLLLEDKHYGLAVHFRLAPHLRGDVFNYLRDISRRLGPAYRLQAGKCVLEIRLTGYSKGTSIAQFMEEAPFRGRRPIFIGDDVTDEDGFAVVNKLNGISIKVGDPESTLAQHRLGGVPDVLAWLEAMPPPILARA